MTEENDEMKAPLATAQFTSESSASLSPPVKANSKLNAAGASAVVGSMTSPASTSRSGKLSDATTAISSDVKGFSSFNPSASTNPTPKNATQSRNPLAGGGTHGGSSAGSTAATPQIVGVGQAKTRTHHHLLVAGGYDDGTDVEALPHGAAENDPNDEMMSTRGRKRARQYGSDNKQKELSGSFKAMSLQSTRHDHESAVGHMNKEREKEQHDADEDENEDEDQDEDEDEDDGEDEDDDDQEDSEVDHMTSWSELMADFYHQDTIDGIVDKLSNVVRHPVFKTSLGKESAQGLILCLVKVAKQQADQSEEQTDQSENA